MNNLRGAKIIYQESKATQPSHLYFLQKDENYCDAIITSESGAKRKLNINVDLSNYYTKNETYPRTEVDALFTQTYNYIDGSFVDYNNTIQVKFLNYYTKVEINSQLLNYYTKTEVNTNLATKLDKGTYTGTAQSLKNEIDSKLNKGSYSGNASDLKNEIDGKANKSTTYTKSEVDTKLEEAIYYSIIY